MCQHLKINQNSVKISGFLICSYMFKEGGDAMEFAVKEFATARPDGIYKQDYLEDLKAMFSPDEELTCPGRPSWEDDANPPLNFSLWKGVGQNGHAVQGNQQPSTSNNAGSAIAPQKGQ
jgi:hypothetical protein